MKDFPPTFLSLVFLVPILKIVTPVRVNLESSPRVPFWKPIPQVGFELSHGFSSEGFLAAFTQLFRENEAWRINFSYFFFSGFLVGFIQIPASLPKEDRDSGLQQTRDHSTFNPGGNEFKLSFVAKKEGSERHLKEFEFFQENLQQPNSEPEPGFSLFSRMRREGSSRKSCNPRTPNRWVETDSTETITNSLERRIRINLMILASVIQKRGILVALKPTEEFLRQERNTNEEEVNKKNSGISLETP